MKPPGELLLLLLLAGLWRSTLPQEAPPVIRIATAVAEELDALADTARVEYARCLYGVSTPDTLWITRATDPGIRSPSTPVTVDPGPCPGFALGLWHVHIPHEISILGIRQGDDHPLDDYCYLSGADITSARRPTEPPLQIVGTGGGQMCWWDRSEILAAHGATLLPRPERRVWLPRLPGSQAPRPRPEIGPVLMEPCRATPCERRHLARGRAR